jgi:O-antigen/teichoic acid export membrane protein
MKPGSFNNILTVPLFKNFISLAGAEALSKLVTFAAFAYLARVLGPAGFGHIEWAGAILMCASLIVDQGFSAYGAREIAKDPERTGTLVSEVVSLRFLLAAAGYSAIAIFAFSVVDDKSVRELLLVYGLSLWLLPLLLQWVFQGHDRMTTAALTQAVRQFVFAAGIFAFVRSTENLLLVGVAEIAGVASAAAFSIWMYRRYFGAERLIRPIISGRLLREGVPIGISQMFWVVKMFGATLIVGLLGSAEETGYFAGAMRILVALHTFVFLYYFNLLPSLSRGWAEGPEKFGRLVASSMRIVLFVSVPATIVWIFAAPAAMTVAYGTDFSRGAGALQWFAGVCLAAAISGHYRFGLIAAGLQTKEMWISALGAVLAAILIPIGYWNGGITGAAAAMCIGEVAVLGCAWMIANRTILNIGQDMSNETNLEAVAEVTR